MATATYVEKQVYSQDGFTTYWFTVDGLDQGTGVEFDNEQYGVSETWDDDDNLDTVIVDCESSIQTEGDAVTIAVRRVAIVTDDMRMPPLHPQAYAPKLMQKTGSQNNGKESSHRIGNHVWRFHHITFHSYNDGQRGWMMMDIDNAKAFVDDFNGAVEFDGLNPDNLSMYFELEPDQARKLGEALIAHADNATVEG